MDTPVRIILSARFIGGVRARSTSNWCVGIGAPVGTKKPMSDVGSTERTVGVGAKIQDT